MVDHLILYSRVAANSSVRQSNCNKVTSETVYVVKKPKIGNVNE